MCHLPPARPAEKPWCDPRFRLRARAGRFHGWLARARGRCRGGETPHSLKGCAPPIVPCPPCSPTHCRAIARPRQWARSGGGWSTHELVGRGGDGRGPARRGSGAGGRKRSPSRFDRLYGVALLFLMRRAVASVCAYVRSGEVVEEVSYLGAIGCDCCSDDWEGREEGAGGAGVGLMKGEGRERESRSVRALATKRGQRVRSPFLPLSPPAAEGETVATDLEQRTATFPVADGSQSRPHGLAFAANLDALRQAQGPITRGTRFVRWAAARCQKMAPSDTGPRVCAQSYAPRRAWAVTGNTSGGRWLGGGERAWACVTSGLIPGCPVSGTLKPGLGGSRKGPKQRTHPRVCRRQTDHRGRRRRGLAAC
jgi:hypothetical protein